MDQTPLSGTRTWQLALVILLALGGFLRLLDLSDPPLDFHPSRQLRNSLVARDIYYSLLPSASAEQKMLADSFAQSVGKYEPPITESITALTYFLAGGESFAVPRVWGALFWLMAALALFDLMRRATSPWAALIALAYYLVLPFSVQASRSFQPDPLMTSAFVTGVYFLYRWSEQQTWKWAVLAGLFFGFAALVKIVIAFFIGSAAVALVLFTLKKDFWKSKQTWMMAALMIFPAFVYYVLLGSGRSTEYFFAWTVALFELITSADFYNKWLVFLGSLFGLTVIFISLAGVLAATPRLRTLLMGLWVGYTLYGLTLPFQMYTHSYYHIQLIPIITLGLAPALDPLIERVSSLGWVRGVFAALILLVVSYQSYVARSILIAEDFRHEPAVWKSIGGAIPENANVIGLTQDYGYRLMLFGWRKVGLWPLNTDLSEIKNEGRDPAANFSDLTADKDYFLVTAFGQLDKQPQLKKILDSYPVAAEGDGFVLYDLKP